MYGKLAGTRSREKVVYRGVASYPRSSLLPTVAFITAAGSVGCDPNEFEDVVLPGGDGAAISGKGAFRFTDPATNRSLDIFYLVPEAAEAATPIVITLHGSGRSASGMRDSWEAKAREKSFIVAAPLFDDDTYPGGSGYNLGNVFDNGNSAIGLNPRSEWAFTLIEPLFDELKRQTNNTSARYDVFGHSAGGQFAHRLVLFIPDGRYNRVLAANPGWYTMPDVTVDFPYGLGDSPFSSAPPAYFDRELVVYSGSEDTNPNSAGLRRNAEADRQGLHRVERANYFFQESRQLAESQGVSYLWQFVNVPGIGHDSSGMSRAAADYLFP